MFNLSNFKQFVKSVFDWAKNNEKDVVLAIAIILIALISFGAGQLTAPKIIQEPVAIEGAPRQLGGAISQNLDFQGDNIKPEGLSSEVPHSGTEEGKFVASKNSKYYHWPWSPSAKRIKEENKIWFNSEEEAQKAGYGRSSNFLQYAPAGYE